MSKKKQLLYLIEAGGVFKIGISSDINKRIVGLQTACAFKVRCVAYYKTEKSARTVEAQLHKLFAPYRLEGEWFDFKGKFTQEAFDSICPRYGMTKLDFLEDGSCLVLEEDGPIKKKKAFGEISEVDGGTYKHSNNQKEIAYWRKRYGLKGERFK